MLPLNYSGGHVSTSAFLKLYFEVGTTFLSQNSSTEHLTLVPYESKFINFVAYFNTSVLKCNLACSIIGVRHTVLDHFHVQTGCQQNY